jgi:phosphatidylglycerophosphate synthase
VTGLLARLPVSANQVTAASLVLGLGAAWAAAEATHGWAIASGLLMVGAYILDNCDGEIARLKMQCFSFGMHFDSFVDWAVHTALFWGLGVGTSAATGDAFWNWLGLAAAMGGTINYALGYILGAGPTTAESARPPVTAGEWVLFMFRELTRADFCFIVLALGLIDALWVLLPAGAIGAQVYWMTALIKRSREFHV